MKISMIIIWSVWTFSKVFAQSYIQYHNTCNEATQLIQLGEFQKAKDMLRPAIEGVDTPQGIDLFSLAKCYSQLNEPDSAEYFLDLGLRTQPFIDDFVALHDQWFVPILGEERWKEITSTDYFRLIERSPEKEALQMQLRELHKLDQHYQKILTDSIRVYYPNDTSLQKLYKDSMQMDDKIIEHFLDSMLANKGWPGKRLSGSNGYASLLLLHVSDSWYVKNKELLIKQIDKGNLMPWDFTDIADRKNFEQDLPIEYNGYNSTKDEITEMIIWNCKNIGAPLGVARNIRVHYRIDGY